MIRVATTEIRRAASTGSHAPAPVAPRSPASAGPRTNPRFAATAPDGLSVSRPSLIRMTVPRPSPSIASAPGAGDPELTTPGVPRADVWVFDAEDLDQGGATSVGGIPVKIVELFGDTPRPLAVSPDGSTVYAGVFKSGNQTTTLAEGVVCDGFAGAPSPCSPDGSDGIMSPNGLAGGDMPGGLPGPSSNHQGIEAPEVGLIVEYDEDSGEWRGPEGRNWSNGVRFFLPDHDVFAIDANTLNEVDTYDHVGTTLFNIAVNPVSGNLYVTNTEAQNLTRFEGTGNFGGSSVNGNLARTRVTVSSSSSPSSSVKSRQSSGDSSRTSRSGDSSTIASLTAAGGSTSVRTTHRSFVRFVIRRTAASLARLPCGHAPAPRPSGQGGDPLASGPESP